MPIKDRLLALVLVSLGLLMVSAAIRSDEARLLRFPALTTSGLDPDFADKGVLDFMLDEGESGVSGGADIHGDSNISFAAEISGDIGLFTTSPNGDQILSQDLVDLGGFENVGGLDTDSQGFTVIGGGTSSPTNENAFVGKFDQDGDPDPIFGTDGIATLDAPATPRDSFGAVLADTNGNVIAAGSSGTFGDFDALVGRFTSTGVLDTNFGGTGFVTFDPDGQSSTSDSARDVAVDGMGSTFVCGQSGDKAFIAKLLEDGGLAQDFGVGGVTTIDHPTRNLNCTSVEVNQNEIAAAGTADQDIFFTFLDQSGVPTSTSGVFFDVGTRSVGNDIPQEIFKGDLTTRDSGDDMILQDDGKIVIFGTTGPFGDEDFVFARFDSQGTLDPSFADGGVLIVDVTSGSFAGDLGSSLELMPDGKLLAAGTTQDFEGLALMRALSVAPGFLFGDGFEGGDTSAWTSTSP